MSAASANDGIAELWIPGPTQVRPEILASCAEPMIGHRTPEMREVIAALDPHLHRAFGTDDVSHSVAVHSCTATALMEMGLRAVGPRVLALTQGAFSERFAEIAEALGKDVTRVASPLGARADLARAAKVLSDGEPFDAVTVCASETSTGALTSPEAIGAILANRRGARILMDVVTLLGAGPLELARHGIDFALAGTQKALALPPGLGLYAVSKDMLASAAPSLSYFLDLRLISRTHAEQKPPMTPTIPLLRALRKQLETITGGTLEREWLGMERREGAGEGGWALRFRRHRQMADRVTAFAKDHGLTRFGAAEGETSPSVTTLDVGGRDVKDLVAALTGRGFTIGTGYGALATSCIRIGHMGDHTPARLEALLEALGHLLGGAVPAQ